VASKNAADVLRAGSVPRTRSTNKELTVFRPEGPKSTNPCYVNKSLQIHPEEFNCGQLSSTYIIQPAFGVPPSVHWRYVRQQVLTYQLRNTTVESLAEYNGPEASKLASG